MSLIKNNRSEKYPEMKLNPITLTFSDECKYLEKDFLRDYAAQSIKYIRLAFLLGLFLYSIFGILDGVLVPENSTC